MFFLSLILQVGAARAQVSHRPLSPADSVNFVNRVEEKEFRFIMDWRYQIEWDGVYEMFSKGSPRHVVVQAGRPDVVRATGPGAGGGRPATAAVRPPALPDLKVPSGGCADSERFQFDVDQHAMQAHLVKNPHNIKQSVCPVFTRLASPAQAPGWRDAPLSIEARNTIRKHRKELLDLLDSAAVIVPGDHWLAGQRVRFYIDQDDAQAASRSAKSCGAEPWWCSALTAYVYNAIGDWPTAVRSVTAARALMPSRVRAHWDDIRLFLTYTGRNAYDAMTPAVRDSLSTIAWWLGDPLFLEDGNDRQVEQLLRRVKAELHVNEMDVWRDWRENYLGPPLVEMVERYGWPAPFSTCGSGMTVARGPPKPYVPGTPSGAAEFTGGKQSAWPIPFRTGDTRFPKGGLGCLSSTVIYPGPEYHTMPAWRAIVDPMHTTVADWDLAPTRDVGNFWDGSWWAPEFYLRRAGPLVPIDFQAALFRRKDTPVLAAAMEWDTVRYTFRPPAAVTVAAITMAGPDAPRIGIRDTMTTAKLHPLTAAIPTGPSVLSLEMVPRSGPGTAGRARIGVDAPPPLSRLHPGEIALSDPVLVRAADGQSEPRNLDDMLARMLPTTSLTQGARVGIFWEVYGLGDRDTVDVSVTMRRHDDAGAIRRIGSRLGLGSSGSDSVSVVWREPRRGDPAAMIDGGVTIRPRGMVFNLSQLAPGKYTLEVRVAKGSMAAFTRRELEIVRR